VTLVVQPEGGPLVDLNDEPVSFTRPTHRVGVVGVAGSRCHIKQVSGDIRETSG
jgi:hypothetical protein